MPFEPGNQESKKADHRKPRRITQRLISFLEESDGSRMQQLIKTLTEKATGGDMTAMGYILDRVDGKVPQAVTGDNDGPIKLIVKWATAPTEAK